MLRGWSRTAVVGAGLGLLLTVGCVPMPDLPEEIAFVYENQGTFLMDWHEGSGGLDPGLPVDDLAGLDGCWGMVRAPGGEIPVKLFSALRFEAQTGTFEGQHLQQDPTGLQIFNVLSVDTGTYEVTTEEGGKEGLLQVVMQTEVNDPDTGGLEPIPLEEPYEQLDLVTLRDDTLYMWDYEAPEGENGIEWVFVYQRFDCPE